MKNPYRQPENIFTWLDCVLFALFFGTLFAAMFLPFFVQI